MKIYSKSDTNYLKKTEKQFEKNRNKTMKISKCITRLVTSVRYYCRNKLKIMQKILIHEVLDAFISLGAFSIQYTVLHGVPRVLNSTDFSTYFWEMKNSFEA